MEENKDKTPRLRKASLILSIVASIICLGFCVYNKFIAKDGDIMIWVVLGLANISLLCSNLYVTKQNKSSD